MPPMPFHLEKGPLFSVLEDYVNADEQRALSMLRTLRLPRDAEGFAELWELPPFHSKTLAGKPGDPYWMDIRGSWCGMDPDKPGKTMWRGYTGDVEAITRKTLITALEVSLGMGAGDGTDTPTRHWPIDFLWNCGLNWFEGWVTYRRHGDAHREGHVTVVFSTPSEGSDIVDRPADHERLRKTADFEVDPRTTKKGGVERRQGHLVITHELNRKPPGATFQPAVRTLLDPPAFDPFAPTQYIGIGTVVVVAPSEVDGGVLAVPRQYEPSEADNAVPT